jgi:hypothetical protein
MLQGITFSQYESALAADGKGEAGNLKKMAESVQKSCKNAVSAYTCTHAIHAHMHML